jgi:Pyruvate/2-oxoacid:ferredoxin oxidoreductase delta subunit
MVSSLYGNVHVLMRFLLFSSLRRYANAVSFSKAIMDPVLALEGDDLPVSVFTPGGYMPAGTTNFEKRAIAPEVPVWKSENCTQCNYCNIVCPHAVIRPFLATRDELKTAPDSFTSLKAQGGAEVAGLQVNVYAEDDDVYTEDYIVYTETLTLRVAGLQYSINLATMDCTGCEVCVESCPDDALFMAPFGEAAEKEVGHILLPWYIHVICMLLHVIDEPARMYYHCALCSHTHDNNNGMLYVINSMSASSSLFSRSPTGTTPCHCRTRATSWISTSSI